MSSGGARPGAGRKKKADAKTSMVWVRVSEENKTKIDILTVEERRRVLIRAAERKLKKDLKTA